MGSPRSPRSAKPSPGGSPKSPPSAVSKSSPAAAAAPAAEHDAGQGLLHGDAVIEAGGSDDDGEFSPAAFDAADSVYDDDGSSRSDSASLRSSILEHSYVNGRRYHRYRHGRYPIPNDESEQNREDMLHTMMLEATDGRLFYAPIVSHPQKVIDLGTGTGLWAIESAPGRQVSQRGDPRPGSEPDTASLGAPQRQVNPPTRPIAASSFYARADKLCGFMVDDVEAEWLNGDEYDFVHLRNMIPILKDPVALLKQAHESNAKSNMKPGAWVELQDVDGDVHTDDDSVPDDWPLKLFTQYVMEAFARFGTNAHAAAFGRQYLEEAGFVNIQHNFVKLPYGTWPKDKLMRLVGMYYRTACEDFFPAVGAIHFPMLGWGKAEMEVFFAQCRQAMRDPQVHAYGKMHFWSGQKPPAD
ncbi:hypothetical protein S7711_02769 [Stachybotrys chartarum IBT 7711]|uniref:Methyltransferase domain-containing protein n=1 Tax=Stachybotrys chartarum (strain CBS 109288 / IBT 7711) TaxID=1280523 RepID=A0A084ALX8_STACB|nr:hypothetical protein S7711_02769 [Stachybotrys chartarum IBT 7711]